MQSLEALRTWAAAHPEQVVAFAYAAMNLLVALVPLRYHTHPLFGLVLRALTRLAAFTPPDAPGTLKVPGTGVEAPQAQPGAPTKREGFARLSLLVPIAALCFVAALALQGCPLPQPDGCTPMATRCSPQGKPQRCSASGRWWSEPASQPCAAVGATCCLAMSPFGNAVHACVPQRVCLPEPTLADALDAVDASEGGAQ